MRVKLVWAYPKSHVTNHLLSLVLGETQLVDSQQQISGALGFEDGTHPVGHLNYLCLCLLSERHERPGGAEAAC